MRSKEMFLLVDVKSELHDVHQVELNFRRQEAFSSSEDPSGLQSGMPSLRKLVKPMDWEKVRSTVTSFAKACEAGCKIGPIGNDTESSQLPLSVQLPGQNGWLAVDATLFPNKVGKVWLHLRGFRPEKPRSRKPLDPIQERGERAARLAT